MRGVRRLRAVLLGAALASLVLAPPAPARAEERWAVTEFGLGTTCAVLNLAYGPVKIVFAVLGAVTGTLAYGLSGGDRDVARAIYQPSLRGDYMIRPENLTRDEPLHFYGRDPQQRGW